MGVHLEEDVRKGCLSEDDDSASGVKKFDNNFSKKKTRGRNNYRQNQHISPVIPVFNLPLVALVCQQTQQVTDQRKTPFGPIPMTYVELLPDLLQNNLVHTRSPPFILEVITWWYKADALCDFHQGTPGHDIENCFPLKIEVKKLIKSGILSFKYVKPLVKHD